MFIIIRNTKTDELRLSGVTPGVQISPDKSYRYSKLYDTERKARRDVERCSVRLEKRLYGTGTQRPIMVPGIVARTKAAK